MYNVNRPPYRTRSVRIAVRDSDVIACVGRYKVRRFKNRNLTGSGARVRRTKKLFVFIIGAEFRKTAQSIYVVLSRNAQQRGSGHENEVVVVSPVHKGVALGVQIPLWPFEFIPAGRASVNQYTYELNLLNFYYLLISKEISFSYSKTIFDSKKIRV